MHQAGKGTSLKTLGPRAGAASRIRVPILEEPDDTTVWRFVRASRPIVLEPRQPHPGYRSIAKRTLDLSISAILLVLMTPILLILAVIIKSTSRGTILFRHQRAGFAGKIFTLLKFRTMKDTPDVGTTPKDGRTFAKLNPYDHRITWIGRFLRRFSLDEIPQLINVLKGDMSLVGPRPLVAEEVVRLQGEDFQRFLMRPGITGLWQVSGRNLVSDRKRRALDRVYVLRWSKWLDLKILLKTLPIVISGRGAR